MQAEPPLRYIRTRYMPVNVGFQCWQIVDRKEDGRPLTASPDSAEPLEFASRADAHDHLRDAGLSCETYIATDHCAAPPRRAT